MTFTYEKVQDLSATIIVKFDEGLKSREPIYPKVAPTIPSNGDSNTYPMGDLPGVREFIGDRIFNKFKEDQYTLINREWESTIEIARKFVEDDNYGFYTARAKALGSDAKGHPDILLGELIKDGFTENGLCYDKVPFFSSEHPYGPADSLQSNIQEGEEEIWVLVDMSRGMFPFFYQERIPTKMEQPEGLSDTTFIKNIYLYGTYGRYAMGYGLWQLAYGSKAPLTKENYELALQSMGALVKRNGQIIGVKPTHIIVGPKNRAKAKQLFNAMLVESGSTNIYYNDVEIIELPYLAITQAVIPEVPDELEVVKEEVSALKTKVGTVETTANEAKTLATTANNKKAQDIVVDPAVEGVATVQEALTALSNKGTKSVTEHGDKNSAKGGK